MWQEIRPCLLALSIALNVPFVSMWAMRGAPVAPKPDPELTKPSVTTAPSVSNGSQGGFRFGFRTPKGRSPLDVSIDMYHRIGVTDEQMAVIRPRVIRFVDAYSELSKQRQKHSLELVNLVATDADHSAIQEKQEQVIECHRQTQDIVVQNMLADMEILTPDQQKALFDSRRRMYDSRGFDKSRGWGPKPSPSPESSSPWPTRGFNESPGSIPSERLPGSRKVQVLGAGLALPTLALSGWAE
jgi:Spy/CpxP family protein refolding chaperone